MKKLLLAFLLVFLSQNNLFAQSVHVVQRGETLESISDKYGVTVEQIKSANPSLKIVFAGAKINIPKASNSKESTQSEIKSTKEKTEVVASNTVKKDKKAKNEKEAPKTKITKEKPQPEINNSLAEEVVSSSSKNDNEKENSLAYNTQSKEKKKIEIFKHREKRELTQEELLEKEAKKERRKERWKKAGKIIGGVATAVGAVAVGILAYKVTDTGDSDFSSTMNQINNGLTSASAVVSKGGIDGIVDGLTHAASLIPKEDYGDYGDGDMLSVRGLIAKLENDNNSYQNEIATAKNKAKARAKAKINGGTGPEFSSRREKNLSRSMDNGAYMNNEWNTRIKWLQAKLNQGQEYISVEEWKNYLHQRGAKLDADLESIKIRRKTQHKRRQSMIDNMKSSNYNTYERQLEMMHDLGYPYNNGYKMEEVRDLQNKMRDARGNNGTKSKWEDWDGIAGSMK